MEIFRPVASGTKLGFSHTKPIYVVDSLDDLRGPSNGTVTLPLSIDWTPASTYDLAVRERVLTMYETVLREAGSEIEVATFVKRTLLSSSWSDLNLSAFVRLA